MAVPNYSMRPIASVNNGGGPSAALGIEPPEWYTKAVCAQTDPEIFFPSKGGSTREAKKVCRNQCEVREDCLMYALINEERFGIWGGYSERERRKLARSV
jgi:WhiB family redox-sensing transcriptional regulator